MPYRKTQTFAVLEAGSDFAKVVRRRRASSKIATPVQPYSWCFCKLCGQQTEYAIAIESVAVFERIKYGAVEVEVSDEMRTNAYARAESLATAYENWLLGRQPGATFPAELLEYWDVREMRGDFSVDAFRDQVERRVLLLEWAKAGHMPEAVRQLRNLEGSQRPSKLYCSLHYSGRSADARRAYQRDRRFLAEYEEVIRMIWAQNAGLIRSWHIDDHALVRHAAYHHIRLMKAPIRLLETCLGQTKTVALHLEMPVLKKPIDDYYAVTQAAHLKLRKLRGEKDWLDNLSQHDAPSQAAIARHLGVSRQAVSAMLKRKAAR